MCSQPLLTHLLLNKNWLEAEISVWAPGISQLSKGALEITAGPRASPMRLNYTNAT